MQSENCFCQKRYEVGTSCIGCRRSLKFLYAKEDPGSTMLGSAPSSLLILLAVGSHGRKQPISVFNKRTDRLALRVTRDDGSQLFRRTPQQSLRSSSVFNRHFLTSKLRGGGSSSMIPLETDLDLVAEMTIEELADHFDSDLEQGLSNSQSIERLDQFGPNSLPTAPRPNIIQLVLEQFTDRLVQILLVVAIISAVFAYLERADGSSLLSAFVEPIVIVTILLVNAAVGVWQTASAQASLDAVSRLLSSTTTVVRNDGTAATIATASLVPGDVIQVRPGQKVPADARIVQSVSAAVLLDESSLTGESVAVAKQEGDLIWAGTVVTAGSATALVVATGKRTKMGEVAAAATATTAAPTPLALQLDQFGHQLSVLIFGICVLVYVASIPKFVEIGGSWQAGALYYAKVAVALGVAAIPEGLPAVITLTLSLACRRMARRNVLVRKLPSMETLGCTSVICTDKTGTLTTNQVRALLESARA